MSKPYQIVAIGEILWDVFPDQARFGGAPANFAGTAAQLMGDAAKVFLVSSVGTDSWGQRARRELSNRGISLQYVQTSQLPTGRVDVKLDDQAKASYEFAKHSAWDEIIWTGELEHLAAETDLICFGTLGQRNEISRQTIERFIDATPTTALRVCDINLRPPFDGREVILKSLQLANILKLNEEELPAIGKLLGLGEGTEAKARTILGRYSIDCLALTLGSEGSMVIRGEAVDRLPATATSIVDTVGAGDAFTAALCKGLLAKEPLATIHQRASRVAAWVCSQSGATPRFPAELLR